MVRVRGLAALLALCLTVPAGAAIQQNTATVSGRLKTLTVFARFSEEAGGADDPIPAFGRQLFDAGRPGSLSHYYLEMSRGQFAVDGDVLATWLTGPRPQAQYLPPLGGYGAFVGDILVALDERLDLGRYDNDGADGVPNSGDDDGYLDFLFVVTQTAPNGFIVESATGIAGLGLYSDFVSTDRAAGGGAIRIRADGHQQGAGGVVQRGHTWEVTVGSMAHELGHVLGLVDLYDLSSLLNPEMEPSGDSAGIGYWGLMGHGNRGWNEHGGPNPMCVWSLKRLGWLGINNGQLQTVTTRIDSARFRDVNAGGSVYQIPIRGTEDYLLVECRMRGTSHYERNLPAEGLLIWRVMESRSSNDNEKAKRVELVCADGYYWDGGYGAGTVADPFGSGSNLDYWAHDAQYRDRSGGNLGDATDVFDGIRFTEYWLASNPAAPAGVSITGIRRRGDAFYATLRTDDPRRAGPIAGTEIWSGRVHVVGDVTVLPGGRLILAPGAEVRFDKDASGTGVDVARTELIIAGDLQMGVSGRDPVRFLSAAENPAPGDWYGIRWSGGSAIALQELVLEHPYIGISAAGSGPVVDLRQVVIRSAAVDGIRLVSDGQTVMLDAVQVHGSGGIGVVIQGTGLAKISDVHLTDNAGGGLLHEGGAIQCVDSRMARNGTAADAANLMLGADTFGVVEGNTLVGGVGLRCVGAKHVVVTHNSFERNRVGVFSHSAQPRISSNVFYGSDLVFEIDGFAVPSRVDLNVVQDARNLVVNRSVAPFEAGNNWWGSVDEAWIQAHVSGEVNWRPFLNFDPRDGIHFELAQNAPNPFSGSTRIRYNVGINELVVAGRTRTVVEVRSVTGSLVRRLVDDLAAPGIYDVVWDGRDEAGRMAASGVYCYELRVGPIVERRRLLVLK